MISGFRATGIYPYDPVAYKKTAASHTNTSSLTGCPSLLLSSSLLARVMSGSPALTGVLRSPALAEPPQQPSAGAAPKTRAKRTLNLSAGVLLTAPQVREEVQRRDDEKEAEQQAKRQRKTDRDEKRVEGGKEAAARAERRAELAATRAAAAAAKPPKAQKQRREAAEVAGGAEEDKENVSPNVPAEVADAQKKPMYVCSVLRRVDGDVLRLRACVSAAR